MDEIGFDLLETFYYQWTYSLILSGDKNQSKLQELVNEIFICPNMDYA